MPRNIELIETRRTAQLKRLAQIRNTLPRTDAITVANFQDWQLELIDVLAARYLSEMAP